MSTRMAQPWGSWPLDLYRGYFMLEARAGIEPANKGFADLSLTTWVPRLMNSQ